MTVVVWGILSEVGNCGASTHKMKELGMGQNALHNLVALIDALLLYICCIPRALFFFFFFFFFAFSNYPASLTNSIVRQRGI